MRAAKIRKGITVLILFAVLLIVLVPLYWSVVLSFDRTSTTQLPEFSLLPHKPSVFNYRMAADYLDLGRYFLNTIFVTVTATVISVSSALCCGYAFAKGRFRGKQICYVIFISVMMLPFESRMLPLFLQYKSWGMLNTYWPLLLGSFAYIYGIFFSRQNIAGIPDSLRESALLDGAGEWKVFFRIIVPLSKPVISTLCILQVISHWNSYLWPLVILRDESKQLISVGVSRFNAMEGSMYYGPRMAVAVLSALPLVIMFLFLQKYIVQSIALSGVKQ